MNQMTIAATILGVGLVGAAFIATNGSFSGNDGVKTFNVVMKNKFL